MFSQNSSKGGKYVGVDEVIKQPGVLMYSLEQPDRISSSMYTIIHLLINL